jgi:hypothetical protein
VHCGKLAPSNFRVNPRILRVQMGVIGFCGGL